MQMLLQTKWAKISYRKAEGGRGIRKPTWAVEGKVKQTCFFSRAMSALECNLYDTELLSACEIETYFSIELAACNKRLS